MTRKDYVAIAGAINEAIQDSQESTRVFKADNNNFDTDRFVDACLRTAA